MARLLRHPTAVIAFTVILSCARPSPGEPMLFLSTQLAPTTEATMMRQVILKDYPLPVEFEPFDRSVFNAKAIELASRPGSMAVLGGLQEDFLVLYRMGALERIDGTLGQPSGRSFSPRLVTRGVFDNGGTYFVPWMQATYLMAANKRALKYLPAGANLSRLTYDELMEWAAAMSRATGKGRLGFPAGPSGLMHRFLQGCLYPSFTGSMADGFSGPSAVAMWRYFRGLWQYATPTSLILNRMDAALLNGDAWVAWDHTARLLDAFKQKPDEFVAFPVPAGPRGRGFISILAGLGLPKGCSLAEPSRLIDYLTSPRAQALTMESVGFLPVVDIGGLTTVSSGLTALARASLDQLGSPDAVLSSLPVLDADAGRRFNLAYMVAFSRIVLRGADPVEVLATQQGKLVDARRNDRDSAADLRGH
jgi:multiple sugar transport system substrate-binding protein